MILDHQHSHSVQLYVNLDEDEDSLPPVKWIHSETIDCINDGLLSVKVLYTCL